jgi:hypothetical protein
MPIRVYAIIFCLSVIMTGCKSSDAPAPASGAGGPGAASPATMASPGTAPATPNTPTVKARIDTCNLLTSDDLKEVQGEAVKEAQRSDRQDGGFIVSQCYYALPTTSNSVVLNVTLAGESGGTVSPRKFWEDTFGKEEREGKDKSRGEREREREKKAKERGGEREEEEEGALPEKITGLGDEAFWIASRVGGALYVLKKDLFFRISVGGAGDEKSKLKKSKTLAQRALKRI